MMSKILVDPVYTYFAEESIDQLMAVERLILRWESNMENPLPFKEVLRTLHSIKGTSGMLDLRSIERIAHTMETLLISIQNKGAKPSRMIMEVFLLAIDQLKILLEVAGRTGTEEGSGGGGNLLAQLEHCIDMIHKEDSNPEIEIEPIQPDSREQVSPSNTTLSSLALTLPFKLAPILEKRVRWTPDLMINNPTLDLIHRKLFQKLGRICNGFVTWEHFQSEENKRRLCTLIGDFVGALVLHYEIENWMLLKKTMSKSFRQAHFREHRNELQFFKELALDFRDGNTHLSTNYIALMMDRFISHIKEFDSASMTGNSNFKYHLKLSKSKSKSKSDSNSNSN